MIGDTEDSHWNDGTGTFTSGKTITSLDKTDSNATNWIVNLDNSPLHFYNTPDNGTTKYDLSSWTSNNSITAPTWKAVKADGTSAGWYMTEALAKAAAGDGGTATQYERAFMGWRSDDMAVQTNDSDSDDVLTVSNLTSDGKTQRGSGQKLIAMNNVKLTNLAAKAPANGTAGSYEAVYGTDITSVLNKLYVAIFGGKEEGSDKETEGLQKQIDELKKTVTTLSEINGIAQYGQYEAKYAVQIYGINVDGTNTITFGPAAGIDYTQTRPAAHIMNETSTDMCIANHTWEEIVEQAKKDPTVFSKCRKNGCVQTVLLTLNVH